MMLINATNKLSKLKVWKVLFILLLTFIVYLRFSTLVNSQEIEFEETPAQSETLSQVFSAYNRSKQRYEDAHREYIIARAAYIKFRTLKSRNDARDATLNMLEARTDVIIYYVQALKASLNEAVGVPSSMTDSLNLRLDEEVDWFSEHRVSLSSAATPEDLAQDSLLAKVRFENASSLFTETSAAISLGRSIDLRERTVEIFSQLRSKVDEIRNENREEYKFGEEKLQTIDRWMAEADSRLFRSSEKINVAENTIVNLGADNKKAKTSYNSLIAALEDSKQYLAESLSYMNEVINEIYTTD